MSAGNTKQLHWTQRVALVRHNLHAASRSGEFGFFKTLQAAGFLEGINYVATLSAALGDGADTILAAMDNLNAGLAYVHQDAFKNVYDNVKDAMREGKGESHDSKLYVDIAMQRNMADMAIDKLSSSAIALISQQTNDVQDTTANVWITGTTIIADTMEIALREMEHLEYKMDDFIRMEESWNTVKASVVGSVTGLRGVYSLMDPSSAQSSGKASARNSSIASASGTMFRRLSNAFAASTSPSTSRRPSVASTKSVAVAASANLANFARNGSVSSVGSSVPVYRTPNYVRNSVSNGCPTAMPASSHFEHHKLSVIPPTPALEFEADPFDMSVPPVPGIPSIVTPPTEQEKMLSKMVS